MAEAMEQDALEGLHISAVEEPSQPSNSKRTYVEDDEDDVKTRGSKAVSRKQLLFMFDLQV